VSASNNKIYYKANDNIERVIAFDTGLYGLSDLNDTITGYFTENGGDLLFYLEADESTSKIILRFNGANISVNCAGENSIMPLLGFPTTMGIIGNLELVKSQKKAQLNSLQTILVKCNLAVDSYFNGKASNIIATFTPNVTSFRNIPFSPYHHLRVKIKSNRIDYMTISLVDQDEKPLDLSGGGLDNELWNVTLTINEHEPFL
jgi:hypothetical protein